MRYFGIAFFILFSLSCSSLNKRVFHSFVKDYPSEVFNVWILTKENKTLSVHSKLELNKRTIIDEAINFKPQDVHFLVKVLEKKNYLYCLDKEEISKLVTQIFKSYKEIERL